MRKLKRLMKVVEILDSSCRNYFVLLRWLDNPNTIYDLIVGLRYPFEIDQ